MRAAIPKFRKRIAELEAFDIASVRDRDDERIGRLDNALEATVTDTFGHNTLEYHRYHTGGLDTAGYNFGSGTSIGEVRDGLQRGVVRAIGQLRSAIEWFEEKLGEAPESPAGRASRGFGGLDLHADLAAAITGLFADGHYAQAVETACKVLSLRVQMVSGRDDLAGKTLMEHVFSVSKPILRFSDLESQSGRDEQQGMMFLYAGAMLALRNPRAHDLIQDDPEQALEYIAFINMLVKSLSRTKR